MNNSVKISYQWFIKTAKENTDQLSFKDLGNKKVTIGIFKLLGKKS